MATPGSTVSTASRVGAASALQSTSPSLVVADFSAWPGENSLGEYANAGEFANGSGSGEVVDGALRLEYDDAGWFLSNVRRDVSAYDALEIDVRGDDGGEAEGVQLEVGDVEGSLSELAEGSIGTEWSTLSVDLESAGVDSSSVQDVWLTFWRAGSGAVEIDELRFVSGDAEGCPDGADSATVDGQVVCDVSDDGWHRDVTGDGVVGQDDVVYFFENQHREAWKREDLFDFSDSGSVGHGDVVALFEYVSL